MECQSQKQLGVISTLPACTTTCNTCIHLRTYFYPAYMYAYSCFHRITSLRTELFYDFISFSFQTSARINKLYTYIRSLVSCVFPKLVLSQYIEIKLFHVCSLLVWWCDMYQVTKNQDGGWKHSVILGLSLLFRNKSSWKLFFIPVMIIK